MSSKITGDVIDALQHCRLKAYFHLRGEQGAQSGYEKLLIEQRANLEPKIIEKIRREYSEAEIATDLNLSVANLHKGASFILGALLEDDCYAVHFDALRKIAGPSALGGFRFEPVLFCAAPRVRALDRQQLATRAVLLAKIQSTLPSGGTVYLGQNSTRTSIRFGSTLTTAENILKESSACSAPKLHRSYY
jgi:predicted RecB family nuclease